MENAMEIDVPQLLSLTKDACISMSAILINVEKCFAEKPDDFVTSEYGLLGGAIGCYCNMFKSAGCQSRKDLETCWSNHFSESSIRDAVEDLLTIEEEWDQFLLKVDKFMDTKSRCVKECNFHTGSNVESTPLMLANINEDSALTIGQASFASHNCSINIISFGSREGATRWKEETLCNFPIWIDENRDLYRALNFKRSMFQVWRIATMIFYGGQLACNIELPKAFTDYIDDPLQMAGNVIFDSKGNIAHIHRCQNPSDRPSVDDMLLILENLK